VPVLPYGVPVYAVQAGTATGDTTIWIEAPVGMPVQHQQLQVVLGSSVQRSLLDILLAPTLACGFDSVRAASSLDVTTSDLMAALALQKLFDKTRDAGTVQAQALDTRIRSALSQLIAAQRDDGGWSWSGHSQQAHRYTTARVYWALTLATKSGYKVADDILGKARGYLQGQLAALAETDYEARAVLLHALSVAGQGDYALANRLHRNKAALSPTALVYTALAFAEMDRKPVANELLAALNNEAALVDLPTRRGSPRGILPWSASGIELRALQALALSKITPEDPKLKEHVDYLLSHRRGHRWAPEKATGPAALVVCDWYARAKYETEKYALKIFVNDLLVKEVTIEKDAETLTVDVTDRLLKAGKNRVNFQLVGRANYAFQAILSGYVPADKLVNTTKEWDVRRTYTPAVLEFDGRDIPRGFDVLTGSYTTFSNPLTELPVGKRGAVSLYVSRNNVPSNTPDDQLDYLVITEPLPSGVSVVESSIKGGFERYEVGAGSITFFVGSRRYIEEIKFEVHGYLPGKYRAAPTVVRNAYRLDDMAVTTPKQLTVLALGDNSKDQYKLTPREQFELGKRNYDKDQFKEAIPYLTDLFKLNLNADIYKQTVQMLFESHLKLGPAGDIVRYFEIIKERFPEQEIPFDKIMLVAAAYDKLGEYERSYMVYRAILENSFLRENSVAGYLEQQGEFLRSVEVMQRLLAEYPPEPYAAAVHYALAQRVYAKAATALNDPKLREKKINRVSLTQQALGMLDNFLTLNPEDPAADQAAFSLANALLELKAYRELIARSTKYAARYPKSDFLDSYWYLVAYGHFALAEHEEALKMARKVADTKRVDPMTGREAESPNKWQAVYILGQVYHSLGRASEAVAEYLRVEDRYADAKQAIEYFLRKEIKLPEVTTLRPNEPAKVELTFRNIPSVDFKVYRIDLMKFSLLKRNLGGITQINLAGIRPSHEETIELGDGKDYRDRKQNLTLNIKEEGAYLVVVRGESLHASGLVLISPLAVEVAEECTAGRVRVTVKDVVADKYLAQVQAKVIGSRNGEFVSGMSDLRGVFIADGIKGKSTVIAQASDGRYAFFRGSEELGPPEATPNQPAAPATKSSPQGKGEPADADGKDGVLIEQLQRGNRMLQDKQREVLDNNYKNNNDGIRAKSAF
jgi:alpha-2-macroglobulin